jgi:hypothetical protein
VQIHLRQGHVRRVLITVEPARLRRGCPRVTACGHRLVVRVRLRVVRVDLLVVRVLGALVYWCFLSPAPLADVVVRAALLTGADVRVLAPGTQGAPAYGIGALCRYP